MEDNAYMLPKIFISQMPYNLKKHCDVTYIVLLRGKKYATKPPHAKDL